MPDVDDLKALNADLQALPARERLKVLAAFSAYEREQILAMLRSTGTEDEEPPLHRFSPWLAQHLSSDDNDETRNITPATRALIGRVLQQIAAKAQPDPHAVEVGRADRPSLLNVLFGRRPSSGESR